MNDTLYLHGLVGGGEEEWVRPSDWMAMPSTAANTIDILAAVFDHDSNYCSVKISTSTGTYRVDWGDGTVDAAVTSNTQIDHLYSYSDADLGPLTTRGYKQALIRITPNTGNITAVNLNVKHARSGLVSTVSNPWLDVAINASSATSISFYSAAAYCTLLERVNVVSSGTLTSLASIFRACWALSKLIVPATFFDSVTNLDAAFANCASLPSITFPAGSLASVTTMAGAFQGCASLKEIVFPSGSLASVGSIASAFSGCTSLNSVTFPAGALASATTASGLFFGCASLKNIEFPTGSLSLCTTLSTAFQGCASLQAVTFPAGSLGLVTTIANAFRDCAALQSVAFSSAGLDADLVTTTTAFFGCPSLSSIANCSIPVSFSVASARLSGAALDAIYTSLPTVTGQTITVTGNHGTVDDTPSIATAKGWTVTT